ncbi:Tha4/Hcf106 protein [Tribonema minus]|uniref:Tha4/Hcf106 protein n=1 Tax=Tribonema minus TaxID=303371 RepID=A0A835YSI8_9STRA|nr:Tha4/Hcf106 protein [Tribonema minus]
MKACAAAVAALAAAGTAQAFVLPVSAPLTACTTCSSSMAVGSRMSAFALAPSSHARLTTRPSRASVSMGLFGLGAPEIAVIIVVAALVLGPEKLTSFAKDAGKMAGELKEVPKEFQAGIDEGEASMKTQMKKAKQLEPQDAETKE